MIYLAIFVLATASTLAAGTASVCERNIGHVENGRAPNAGWSAFPSIPFSPLTVLGIAWLAERSWPGFGAWTVLGLLALTLPFHLVYFKIRNRKLQQLLDTEKESAKEHGHQRRDQ